MKDFDTILYSKRDRTAWVTLNRPEARNAMNSRMRSELIRSLEDANEDPEVHVVVLTGAGEKAFCAGGDITEFPKLLPPDQFARHAATHPLVFVRQMSKPVVAMVNGLALGGGCETVLASDIAIASENAQFGQPEIMVGVIPGAGGTQVLPRLVGEKRAKELIFTGRMISAEEALALGVVNQVVPQDKLKETTEAFVKTLQKRSPVILQLAKLAINRSLETTLSAGLACERDLFALCFGTEDQKEAACAFLEKRKAIYRGR
jgi:enoyl-CoA hydratase